LRTQALAAVAALTTIIGIFAKSANAGATWEIVAFTFAILIAFWIAIWVLDFWYYNRLLIGAVDTLCDLEKESENKLRIRHITMSTKIEAAVGRDGATLPDAWKLARGQRAFYVLVLLTLICGFVFSVFNCIYAPPFNH
jgi:hypothetical protein